jgi:hypothetical protein
MYCPKCKMMIIGENESSYHIHDIIEHEEDFQNNFIELSKEQMTDITINIAKAFYFQEQ